jgi:hypothetical protein
LLGCELPPDVLRLPFVANPIVPIRRVRKLKALVRGFVFGY